MKVTVGKIKKRKVIKYCIGLLTPLFFYLFLLMNIDLGYDNYKECLLFIGDGRIGAYGYIYSLLG